MDKPNRPLYEFGPFRLDAQAHLLYRGERAVPLTPKVFDTLLVLVEHRGQVLTKEALLQAIWPDSLVEESSLSQNIFLLRRMLKEDGDDRTFIETIPRRGYRFAAEVRPVAAEVRPVAAGVSQAVDIETVFQQRSETRIVIEDEFEAAPDAPLRISETAAQLTARPAVATEPHRATNLPAVRALIKRRPASAWLLVAVFTLFIPTLIVGSKTFSRSAHPKLQAETAFQTFDLNRLTDSGKVDKLAISPDGKYIAYVEENGQQSLWLRQRVSGNALELLPATESQFIGLSFSPDGNYLYYTLQATPAGQGILFRVATLGGPAVKVLENVGSPIAFAPDGRQFAFVRGETGKAETLLMAANTDGSATRVVAQRTRPSFFAKQGPSWSPDGKLIACAGGSIVLGKAKMGVLAVKVADGSSQEFAPPNWSWVGQVAWLPDGSGLALVSWNEETPQLIDQLWLLSYPGGETRRITTDLEGFGGISLAGDASTLAALRADRHTGLWLVPRGTERPARQIATGFSDPAGGEFLALTPDGKIVFSSSVGGHPDLWLMEQDGTRKKQLTDDPVEEERPVLTADGRYIYFGSKRAGVPHIWRVELDGSNLTQVTNGAGELSPSLTPDGRWPIYSHVAENFSLWKIAVAGGAPVRLTNKAALNPALSPDGKWVACYLKNIPDAPLQLTLLSFNSDEPAKVLDAPSLVNYPPLKWAPDGHAITYVKTQASVSNVWGQAPKGGPVKQLTNFTADQLFRFAWAPDGKRLLCERGTMQRDIVALSNR
jgi:Tol biopolymer transport system component/DNA-binding winged helix-turn-helix (wHTH) protein